MILKKIMQWNEIEKHGLSSRPIRPSNSRLKLNWVLTAGFAGAFCKDIVHTRENVLA
jgi:hypothetical protein